MHIHKQKKTFGVKLIAVTSLVLSGNVYLLLNKIERKKKKLKNRMIIKYINLVLRITK
jgi:hypothetical protein